MRYRLMTALALLTLLLAADGVRAQEPEAFGVPYKPDPPPAIDGRLDEWEPIPNARKVDTREQAVWSGQKWAGPQDLSAKVWLAWRQEYLYLAVDVADDRHVQKGHGDAMWKGDHIELYLDAAPDLEPDRKGFGQGQMQFGFSPGNLEKTGDPLTDIAPGAVVFTPEGQKASGVIVAAQKTDKGYALEAAVPWALIQSLAKQPPDTPAAGRPINIEVGVSDTDGPEAAQEKMMTLLTATWGPRNRGRLMAAVLAPSDGKAPPIVRGVELFKTLELKTGEKKEIGFQGLAPASAKPSGGRAAPEKEAVLTLKARLDTPTVAGYTRALRLTLNGQALDGKRLMNRKAEELRADGRTMSAAAGEIFNTTYAPDFAAPDKNTSYGLRSGAKLCVFDLRVTDLLREGANVLVVENRALPELKRSLVVGDGQLQLRAVVKPRVRRPAPAGPLPVIEPAHTFKVNYSLTQSPDGAMTLAVGAPRIRGGETFRVESEFSTPEPAWVKGSNKYFDFKREIEQKDEAILVRDTFANLTGEILPLMQRHRIVSAANLKKVWLAGLSPSTLNSTSTHAGNPTSYGVTEKAGVGVMAWEDALQVHVTNFSTENSVGLADNQFVLRPRAKHTSEWVIFPTNAPDYYAFLNAARRFRDANFRLDGSFAFLSIGPNRITDKWSDQQFRDFIRFKNAYFVCDGYLWPTYKGRFPHGTVFQSMDWTYFRKQLERVKQIEPAAKHLLYFHCFLDVLDEGPEKYADARLLRIDGTQADYGKPFDRIYVPTETNAFGRDMARNVDLILGPPPDGFGCHGVYWDEFEYSRYQYHYDDYSKPAPPIPWDGVSADIDPKTMKVVRLKTSVTLVSQPYRMALARRIMEGGRPLIGNGQPHTRTAVNLRFPRFVETGSISRCADAQIFSPIALGDHLTERSEEDAYGVMLGALNYGCVYYWYSCEHVPVSRPHLTQYMFPITPMELREGIIIGKERIITNRSGLFGWGDNASLERRAASLERRAASHEVHVFDEQGKEVPDFKTPSVVKDGKTYTELRLAEDWSAAIVRR